MVRQKIGQLYLNNEDTKLTFEEAYNKCIYEKKALGAVDSTINGYNTAWGFFKNFIEVIEKDKKNPLTWEDIDEDLIIKFLTYLKENTKANDRTRFTYMGNLRVILKYFMKKGYIKEHFKIQMPSYEKKIIKTYASDDLEKLLKKPSMTKKHFDFVEYRNWVIVCFLVDAGCRAGTLIDLRIEDVDFDNNLIAFNKVKNKKAYMTPMSDTLSHILSEYISIRKGEPEDYLFCTQYGDKLKYAGLRSAIERYNKKRGATKVGLHRYRHTFSKSVAIKSKNSFLLQKMLGHSSIKMSQNYVNMFAGDIQENYNKVSLLNTEYKSTVNKQKIKL